MNICKCGHPMSHHFRWDGASSKCRVRPDGRLANSGSECQCSCQKAEVAHAMSKPAMTTKEALAKAIIALRGCGHAECERAAVVLEDYDTIKKLEEMPSPKRLKPISPEAQSLVDSLEV